MVGGLKSSFSINAACSTIAILRLDLGTLEWDEVGRMPEEMFRWFQESSKFKVFGGGERVCFSARRVKRLAIWDCSEEGKGEWSWIDGVPGSGDGLCRGFLYEARLTAVRASSEDVLVSYLEEFAKMLPRCFESRIEKYQINGFDVSPLSFLLTNILALRITDIIDGEDLYLDPVSKFITSIAENGFGLVMHVKRTKMKEHAW
ncbi:hypothetical protein Scep_018779 [Stephania cephalantha]|uniref:Uncharacterized protein n=1 Tax=Stephania cephalantha TaxID=152367 RepID=A0AAP0I9Q1_9MAGN